MTTCVGTAGLQPRSFLRSRDALFRCEAQPLLDALERRVELSGVLTVMPPVSLAMATTPWVGNR
jgi:hypothetical protein